MTFVSNMICDKVIPTSDYLANLPTMAISTSKDKWQSTIICYTYREHTGGVPGLNTPESQKDRLQRQIRWWQELDRMGEELVILGDINLDKTLVWPAS